MNIPWGSPIRIGTEILKTKIILNPSPQLKKTEENGELKKSLLKSRLHYHLSVTKTGKVDEDNEKVNQGICQ